MLAVGAAHADALYGNNTSTAAVTWYYNEYGSLNITNDCQHFAAGQPAPCGDGFRTADSGKGATASDVSVLGHSTASAHAVSSWPSQFSSGANTRSYWWDTFTVSSLSVAPGSLVDLTLRTHYTGALDAFVSAPDITCDRTGGNTACASSFAGFGTLLDGPLTTAVGTLQFPNPAPASDATGILQVRVDSPFTLVGQLSANASAGSINNSTRYVGSANGSADFYIDLPPDLTLASASGHIYGPVPEPGIPAMMLAGLALVGKAVRRRKPV